MIEQDRKEFKDAIAVLFAAFRQEATKAVYEGYWLGLRDLKLTEIQLAVATGIRDCQFVPPASELRKLTGTLLPDDRSILAWEAFRKALLKHGYYASVNFDDPVINATVRNLGGWCELIERIEDDDKTDKWVRRDFERIYQSLCRTGVGPESARYLSGRCERDNRLNGYADQIPSPMKVLTGLPAHPAGVVQIEGPRTQADPLALAEDIGKMPE